MKRAVQCVCVAIKTIRVHPPWSKKVRVGPSWLNTESLLPPQGAKVPPQEHLLPSIETILVTLLVYFYSLVKSCFMEFHSSKVKKKPTE